MTPEEEEVDQKRAYANLRAMVDGWERDGIKLKKVDLETPVMTIPGSALHPYQQKGHTGEFFAKIEGEFTPSWKNPPPEDTPTFHTPDVVARTGVTYRQLTHWIDKGYISPSHHRGRGSGDPHVFTEEDVREIEDIRDLIEQGMSLQRITDLNPDTRSRVLTAIKGALE